ncbi:FGGY family carbohydrate kinase [Sphaerisporangium perillae]|uniref:FGGY family carbohydrate kinase n=1 Tax=Sphaerisporangium perillae TaxID=2935860 RepID=UPI00200D3BEF|nr:FGGY family carbohydrate kinase [Sphaerisporangium perillae]
MTSATVLAIDQGTSGTKALMVCPERGIIGSGYAGVRPRYGAGGSVEQDPMELLRSVLDAGRRAIAAAGEPVAAVGLANQGETVLAWDPVTGEPLTDAVVWQDRRAQPVCDELAGEAERLARLSGLPLDPYFAAPKMAWLRRNLTREGVVTTSDAWLVHRLTGAFVTDASTASRTMLLDLDRTEWSPEALETFGLRDERLPEVVDASGAFGETGAFTEAGGSGALGSSGVASAGGSGPAVPLTGLLVDQQAALLAQGCLEAGTAKCTYGTGAFLLANAGHQAVRSSAGLAACVAWRLAGRPTYCLDGQVYTVASAVRWLTDLGVIGGADDLDRLGGSVPDAGGVTFVPAFAGLAAPSWRGGVRASLTGLGLDITPAHIVRALCDGIAAQVVELAGAMAGDLGRTPSVLRADGGLTRSKVLMQTQADLLQAPVEVYASPDATALGVAAAARMGLDPSLQVADATVQGPPSAVYEPRVSADEAAHRLGAYAAAVRALLADTGPKTEENR